MRSTQFATLLALAAAPALGQGPAQGGQYPSCATSCINSSLSGFSGSLQSACSDSSRLSTLNTCLASSTCSDADKNTINSHISSLCGNGGSTLATVTAPPGTTATSEAAAIAAYNSYTSAHPSGWSSSDWVSFTSQYPLPSDSPWTGTGPPPYAATGTSGSPNNNPFVAMAGGSFPGGGSGFPFGGMGGGPFGSGMGGWSPAQGGPFGGSGGYGPWASSGAWTTGAWTSWWGGSMCPPATWSGWTSGSWSSSAPWTTWTACTAKTTAATAYTTTVSGVPVTGTSFGYQVAQAQSTGGSTFASGAAGGRAARDGRAAASGAAVLAFVAAVLVL